MIQISDLSYAYGRKPLFDAVSLELDPGQFISILGPNGCGKSTLLNLITGYLTPTTGRVAISGHQIHAMKDLQRAQLFTMVRQQQGNLFPYRCADYILLGRRPHRHMLEDYTEEDIRIAEAVMATTFTEPFSEKLLHELSGGEFQRVVFAKALAQQTAYLFLDEAFSAMDIYHTIKCMDILKQMVRSQQATVVCVMHDMNMAYRYSDSIVLMKEGSVVGAGKPKDVLTETSIKAVYGIDVEYIKNKGFLIQGGKS